MSGSEPSSTLAAIGLAAVGSVAWLVYFNLKDRLSPEPKRRIAQAFGLGMVAAGLAWGGYYASALLGFPPTPPREPVPLIVYCLVVVGVVEEGSKFLVARVFCFRWKEFDERIDGLIYAAAVGLGFAAVENVLFLVALPPVHGVLRVIVSPLTHSLFAAVWGFGASRALLVPRSATSRFLLQAISLALAMAAHGIYDVAVLIEDWMPIAAVVVAVLWALVIWRSQCLLRTAEKELRPE